MKILGLALISLLILVYATGFFLPSERSAQKTARIKAPPEKVFATITDLSRQGWRSQVDQVEVLDSTPGREVWLERPKWGPPHKFRTRLKNPPHRFEIEMIDNPSFGGFWVGTLRATENGETEIEFTEHVIVNGPFAKVMSRLFFDLESSITTYIEDLKRATE